MQTKAQCLQDKSLKRTIDDMTIGVDTTKNGDTVMYSAVYQDSLGKEKKSKKSE